MKIYFLMFWRVVSAPFRFLFRLIRGIVHFLINSMRGAFHFFTVNPVEVSLTETFGKAVKAPKNFSMEVLLHISDFRWHLVRVILVIGVATGFSLAYTEDLLAWLATPIGGIENLQAIDVTEPIGVVMRIALLAGFTISIPYISFEFLLFSYKGLMVKARLRWLLSIPLTSILFAAGMIFAFEYMLPPALDVLLNIMGIVTLPRPASYIRFVTGLMFWFGIAFQLPLITYFLASINLIKAETLRKQWRLAVVILSIVAAAVTPTVDPINMAIVLVPLLVLYALSVAMAYLAQGRNPTETK